MLAQKYTISGYIKDSDSEESLIGANVFDLKTKSGTSLNSTDRRRKQNVNIPSERARKLNCVGKVVRSLKSLL